MPEVFSQRKIGARRGEAAMCPFWYMGWQSEEWSYKCLKCKRPVSEQLDVRFLTIYDGEHDRWLRATLCPQCWQEAMDLFKTILPDEWTEAAEGFMRPPPPKPQKETEHEREE